MWNFLKTPTARELAERELQEAEREYLRAQSARDYADAAVSYNLTRIERLRAALSKEAAK